MSDPQPRAFPQISVVSDTARGETSPGFRHVQGFLTRFGYLTTDTFSTGTLDAASARALLEFQRFSRLPQTGEFDAATRKQMTLPRCALPDFGRDVGFSTTCAWQRWSLTYAFDTGTPDVGGDAEWDAIRAAFRTWEALTPLIFREVALGDNPDIRVGWRPSTDPDLNMVGGTLAHADFPPGCGVVTDGALPKPVHFDDPEHIWSVGAAQGAFDIETVALHEIGHIVGLAHSSVPGAVMLPTISSNSIKRSLTQDDIDGFRQLYPVSTRADWLTPVLHVMMN